MSDHIQIIPRRPPCCLLFVSLSFCPPHWDHLRLRGPQRADKPKNPSSSRCRFSQVPRLTCFPVASGLGNLTRCRWGRRRTNSSPLGGTHALLATSGLGQGAGEVLVRWGKKQHHGEKHCCWGEGRPWREAVLPLRPPGCTRSQCLSVIAQHLPKAQLSKCNAMSKWASAMQWQNNSM